MKTKTLFRNSSHSNSSSHDCLVKEINGRKVKLTYEAYNAVEKCNVELFDGNKWNVILTMIDMGIVPNTSAYNIWDAAKRKDRAEEIFKTAEKLIGSILS